MNEPRTDLRCPFEDVLDRRILGDVTPEERANLEAHVQTGCPTCAPRFRSEEHLETLVAAHLGGIVEETEKRRGVVLDRLKDRLEREDDRRQQRRFRRLGMNALLLLFVLGGVVLISTEYLMTAALAKKLVRAQRDAADTEIHAVLVALKRYHDERGSHVPPDEVALVRALGTTRLDGRLPYYSIDASQLDEKGRLLDPWRHPYVYKADAMGVWLQSCGANGRDEGGIGDDVVRQMIFK